MRIHHKLWKYDHVSQNTCEQIVMISRSFVKCDNQKVRYSHVLTSSWAYTTSSGCTITYAREHVNIQSSKEGQVIIKKLRRKLIFQAFGKLQNTPLRKNKKKVHSKFGRDRMNGVGWKSEKPMVERERGGWRSRSKS